MITSTPRKNSVFQFSFTDFITQLRLLWWCEWVKSLVDKKLFLNAECSNCIKFES